LQPASPEWSVVLAFDAGERLAPEDVRVLCDFAEGLPEDMRIRIAVSTYAGGRQDIVDELRRVGAAVADIELEGMAEDGIPRMARRQGSHRCRCGSATTRDGYAL
jgi:hypothetical protein